jgi:hypothetical protein
LTKERNLQEKRFPPISTNVLSLSACVPPLPDDIDVDFILSDDIHDDFILPDDIDDDFIEDEMMKNV